jgi:hypothetical protein
MRVESEKLESKRYAVVDHEVRATDVGSNGLPMDFTGMAGSVRQIVRFDGRRYNVVMEAEKQLESLTKAIADAKKDIGA